MSSQKYAITPYSIETLLNWVQAGEIAIPEIQRPFVWDTSKVRDLLDSLLKGYPVGYLITWQNPSVRLRDGTSAAGKRILIDGQQRMTALTAAVLGHEIVTKDYQRARIRIAYHPLEARFEVLNSILAKNAAWFPDIADLFDQKTSRYETVNKYCANNPEATPDEVHRSLERLFMIKSNQIGVIGLDSSLDIATVTEIFIRVNSMGVELNEADFAMSRIAVNMRYGGHKLRKAIDYFDHLSRKPEAFGAIQRNDTEFAATDYFSALAWLKDENDDLYDPTFVDILRVAFTSQFKRGRLADLVALLSGRNFDTRQHEEDIVEDTFTRLSAGVLRFMNETNFKRLIMIIKSAGFVSPSMITSKNALNFAYILLLHLRDERAPYDVVDRCVRRWFVMSILTERYSGSPESTFSQDIEQIKRHGVEPYLNSLTDGLLSESFWGVTLPQRLETTAINSPFFQVYKAAQIKTNDRGFLSRDISIRELIENRSDVHHVFPKDYLKKHGRSKTEYNQIANYVIAESPINIQIGNREPAIYFGQLREQVSGGSRHYGNITSPDELDANLEMNCIPEGIETMTEADYPRFLALRRRLMAAKIKRFFELL